MDEQKSSAWTIDRGVRSGDPFFAVGDQLARRQVWIMASLATAYKECERCGGVAEMETDDGVSLCEGCAPGAQLGVL